MTIYFINNFNLKMLFKTFITLIIICNIGDSGSSFASHSNGRAYTVGIASWVPGMYSNLPLVFAAKVPDLQQWIESIIKPNKRS